MAEDLEVADGSSGSSMSGSVERSDIEVDENGKSWWQ